MLASSHLIFNIWRLKWKESSSALCMFIQICTLKIGIGWRNKCVYFKTVQVFLLTILILLKTFKIAAILGDFNLKTEEDADMKKLEYFLPDFQIFIRGPTFQRSDYFSSLDHVLVSKTLFEPFYCTAFRNIYSDHSSISLR